MTTGCDGGGQMPSQETAKLNFVDLFCGAGGFTLAGTKAGLQPVFAIENNKYATLTYQRAFCRGNDGPTLYTDSILTLDPEKLLKAHFEEAGACDLVLGGPPCQGFSTHRINDAGVDDPRNKLILSYFSFVKALKPKAFLMENVPGILWPRHEKFLQEFFDEADKADYDVFPAAKLDARDYGVPQRRRRVFFLGVRRGLDTSGLVWPPVPTHAQEPSDGLKPWLNCSNVFVAAPDNDPNDIHMNHGPELTELFKATPINGGSRKDTKRVLKCHEEHDGHKDVYGRIDPSKPAPTMTTACINPSKGRFVHPKKPHGITVREAARIQTFPDDFVFEGGLTAAGQQVGNAVPIELGKVLIQQLAVWLQGLYGAGKVKPLEDSNFEREVI